MELLRSSLASFNHTTSSTTTTSIASIIIDDLLGFNDSAECREVTRLSDIGLQCEFARVVDDCYDDNKIDYIKLTYCVLESQLAATLLFIVMLAFLFLAIGTTADDFLCPLLVSISKSLKLSDNIAGVTFLAFGNGAPDIFSSIIGIGNADPSMVIGQLYGGGIFVTTIVVGSILLRERFTIMHRPLLRDIAFYLVTTGLVWATFLSEAITLLHSCLFITIYLVYVIVVVASGVVYRRRRLIKEQELENGGVSIFGKRGTTMPRDRLKRGKKYHVQEVGEQVLNRQNSSESSVSSSTLSLKSLFRRQNSDNYEGVVLRRIKFRHYPHDFPLFNRRLTAYNISATPPSQTTYPGSEPEVKRIRQRSPSRPDLVLEVEENLATFRQIMKDSTELNCSPENSNPTRPVLDVNHNEPNEEDLNHQNLNNNEIHISQKPELLLSLKELLDARRMTISDPSFPAPKFNKKSPNNEKDENILPPEKFTPTALFSNLNLVFRQLLSGNKKDQNDKIKNEVVETEISAKTVGQTEFAPHESSLPYQVKFAENKRNFSWWNTMFEILLKASHFDLEELAESSWLGKALMVVKAPIYLVFTLTIPVVDVELPEGGWNRPLALLQLILSPQCCLLITELTIAPLSRLQIHLLFFAVSFIVIVFVAGTSGNAVAPKYHIALAYFGFIVAISWIYTIANEVVSLLKAIGVIFNLSQFMLGLTFLAWGNSIGDFISNLTMARNGFPRMAISACFGGPVLNMLLGVGIPYTYLLIKQKQTMSMPSIELVYSRMISIMYGTITLSLVTTVVVLVFVTKFASAKFHGFILYGLYASFLGSAIFTEIKNLS